jgi:hypothetical protein
METKISGTLLGRELYQIATEPAALDVLQALDREKLLSLFAPSLTGAKLNVIGFQKLQKARQVVPIEAGLRVDEFTLFLNLLVEKLSPKERKQLLAATEIDKSKLDAALRLDTNMKKLERALGSAKVQKASALYAVLSKVPGEEVLHLLMKSNQRLVVDRTRNYLQKHLLTAQEVTDAMVMEKGVTPGSPKFAKVREEMVAARLDSRPRKVPAIEIPPPPPPPVAPARRQSTWGR